MRLIRDNIHAFVAFLSAEIDQKHVRKKELKSTTTKISKIENKSNTNKENNHFKQASQLCEMMDELKLVVQFYLKEDLK